MQIHCLPRTFYKLYHHSSKNLIQAEQLEQRKKCLGDWEILKKRGVPDTEIARVTGISRATHYRRKKAIKMYGLYAVLNRSKRPHRVRKSCIPKITTDTILTIRKQNPTYGKAKVTVILKRDYGIIISQSSVGRIIKSYINKGIIAVSRAATREKRGRLFSKHAKRWAYGSRSGIPGELIQIDHMSVSKNERIFKHFQAWDPCTKTIVADVFTSASSIAAKDFLLKVIQELPFPVRSIQVDGGSEFMNHFEQACAEKHIPLYVLPPRRPQYNGGVERTNRSTREEFYDDPHLLANSITEMQTELASCVKKYNSFRPHHSLQGYTPSEYTQQILMKQAQSQML
jgi:transposase